MPKIITIAHQKGGVGKSTLAINIAYALAQKVPVAVVDLDPQGTISSMRTHIDAENIEILEFTRDIAALPRIKQQVVIVDTPPYNTEQLPELLAVSDIVIVPTKAGLPDVMAIQLTLNTIMQAQRKKPALKAGIVINMIKPRSALTESAKKQLKSYLTFPVIAEIRDRVVYGRTLINGGVVSSDDAQGVDEMNGLTNEILKML